MVDELKYRGEPGYILEEILLKAGFKYREPAPPKLVQKTLGCPGVGWVTVTRNRFERQNLAFQPVATVTLKTY